VFINKDEEGYLKKEFFSSRMNISFNLTSKDRLMAVEIMHFDTM